VAHAGFILVGVLAVSEAGISSTMFYLLAYGFATLGAFAVVSIVRDSSGEATQISQYAGLGKRSPVVASVFALFLLAFAGIPLTSGFTGKFGVFSAAIAGGATPVVIVAVFASVISAFFYARIITMMFFREPAEDGPRVVLPSAFTSLALAIGVAVTVVLGVLPQPVLELAQQAGIFLR
jgi:NADH-quinone oxidoreductase subunit N